MTLMKKERQMNQLAEETCGYWLAYSLNLLVEPHTKEPEKQMSFERLGQRIFETEKITWGK